MTCRLSHVVMVTVLSLTAQALADVGDPQVRTDHPWYPGELAISTFDRLCSRRKPRFTSALLAMRVDSDEHQAPWRRGCGETRTIGMDKLATVIFGAKGLPPEATLRLREYWNGLFGYGFGLMWYDTFAVDGRVRIPARSWPRTRCRSVRTQCI